MKINEERLRAAKESRELKRKSEDKGEGRRESVGKVRRSSTRQIPS